jgi:hypothetical protein
MKYDLQNKVQLIKFQERLKILIEQEKFVELKIIHPVRSNQQNRYLHLILGYFASEYGETMEYVKEHFFKDVVNPLIFTIQYQNTVKGYMRPAWRSTATLTTLELTVAIERFRDYASKEAGIYLPEPNEEEFLTHCETEVERQKQYI